MSRPSLVPTQRLKKTESKRSHWACTGRAKFPAGLRRALAVAVRETLAKMPEVVAVLGYPMNGTIRLVSVLDDRSDQVILRLAERELALMVRLKDFLFDLRTTGVDRLEAWLVAGYIPITPGSGT